MHDGERVINKEFELALEATIREARAGNHEYLTVEHILFAVLHDELGAGIIMGCGGNISRMKLSLKKFFEEKVPKVEGYSEIYPQPTLGFQKVFQRALLHAGSTSKK